mgnify:CR=1 FL=1
MDREDKIINKLIEMDAKMDSFATKETLHELEDRMLTHFDEQSVILKRLDEDRYMTKARIDRHEVRIEALEERRP